MYRNLNPMALGITGRQSELIELALTYGFGGLDLDIAGIVKRARTNGSDQACRFISSAGIHGGGFELPIDLAAPEANFQSSMTELAEYAEIASRLSAKCCQITVLPLSQGMPYQECFEMHRSRLSTVAEKLSGQDIRLGLAFHAAPGHREDVETPFIHAGEELLTLIRTIGSPAVGIALDSWNWIVGGGTVESLCQIPSESVVSLRLADIAADVDLSAITDQQRILPIERGQIDCRAIIQHFIGNEFEGPITLWPEPTTLAGMTRDAIVQLAKATFNDLYNPTPPADAASVVDVEVAAADQAPVEEPAEAAGE